MSRLTAALLSHLLVVSAAAAQTPATLDSIDRYVRTEVTRYRIPGLSLAVLRGDSVVLARGYGYANVEQDRKSTRLNSSHLVISYAVFCLKKKKHYLLHVPSTSSYLLHPSHPHRALCSRAP